MILPGREQVYSECDATSEHRVRAMVDAHPADSYYQFHREWLLIKDAERREQRETEDHARAERALAAAEASATASGKAAAAAHLAARATLWAAVFALITIIVSVLKDWIGRP